MAAEVQRLVALGDSLAEGVGDPLPDGSHRGWVDVLANELADAHPGLVYANLAVRGSTVQRIRDVQLPVALALRPDLVVLAAGMNDLLRPSFDDVEFAHALDTLFGAPVRLGARVLAVSLPDLSRVLPIARPLRRRALRQREVLLDRAHARGALVLDLWTLPETWDLALWSADRTHPNARGHQLLAQRAAGLVGGAAAASTVEDAAGPLPRLGWFDAVWTVGVLAPWLLRRLVGRSSADGRVGKRPVLGPP